MRLRIGSLSALLLGLLTGVEAGAAEPEDVIVVPEVRSEIEVPTVAVEPEASEAEVQQSAERGQGSTKEEESAASSETSSEGPPTPVIEELTVRGSEVSTALPETAYDVGTVDTSELSLRSYDLGEILTRFTPVTVQRAGGLGSRGTYALGGLGGERLRFFLDGVPLALTAYSGGVANIPVGLLSGIEVYQGVVPVRFAGDALGGAVNLVTHPNIRQTRFSASYQFGSFSTHRVAVSGQYAHRDSGFFARGSAFLDDTANDYDVDVTVTNSRGQDSPYTGSRFHDGYRGLGLVLAVGLTDQSWAERLVIEGFGSDFDKDVQNGTGTMDVPYGEVEFDREAYGGKLEYAVGLGASTWLELRAGYTRRQSLFSDLSDCIYAWDGSCAPAPNGSKGETSNNATERYLQTDTLFLRPTVTQHLSDAHQLDFAVSIDRSERTGENRLLADGYDRLERPRSLWVSVAGVELGSRFFDDALRNTAFVKGYLMHTEAYDLLATGEWRDASQTMFQGGGGDSLRYFFNPEWAVSTSYEYATRFPTIDEIYGNGLVLENLDLSPETSHNVNLGTQLSALETELGTWRGSVNGFFRWSEDLITTFSDGNTSSATNIAAARALGVEGGLGWTSPGGWVTVDGRATFQDLRNEATTTDYAQYRGQRIPNIPHLTASGRAGFNLFELFADGDSVELGYRLRFVDGFLVGFEGNTRNGDKLAVDPQLSHDLSLTYSVQLAGVTVAASVEATNVTDTKLFDFYGVQRPGRAFYTKWTIR